MKKISALFLALACGFVGFNVQATELTGAQITATECDVLDEPVAPSKSKDINAAYECSTAKNMIRVATCHVAGRKKEEQLTCTQLGTDPSGAPIYIAGCDATTATIDSGTNGKAFVGTSSGGGIAAAPLSGACAAATVGAHVAIGE